MNILIASITDSGIVRVRKEIIKDLIAKGHSITVTTPVGNDVPKLVDMGCKFIPINIDAHGTNPIKDLGVYFSYRKILKQVNPDVVFTFTPKANVYCGMACRFMNIPVVMNITGLGTALAYPGYKQKVLLALYKIATKGIYRIFFQNSSNMEFFKQHGLGSDESYRLLPGSGINLEDFPYQPYPESDEQINFLYIARVQKAKGIDQYLDAAREIRKTYPNVIFHVLGSCDSKYEQIIRKAHEDRTIEYHGRVNNVAEFEKESHATVMPTYYPEGMCNVLLEAGATGRPIITTNHPGCRETVNDGETGFIVEKQNSQSLIEAIRKLLSLSNRERAEMGAKGREKIVKEFDRVKVIEAYWNAVQELKTCEGK